MVNQHHVISMSYSQDSGYINVTDYLKHGSNDFTFTVFNYFGGYTWGFEIRKNNDLIFTDKAGTVEGFVQIIMISQNRINVFTIKRLLLLFLCVLEQHYSVTIKAKNDLFVLFFNKNTHFNYNSMV
jgi:hypothetical protein